MTSRLLDPLFLSLLILLAGLLGWTIHRPFKTLWGWKAVAWTGLVLLWLSASPWFANGITRKLEPKPMDLSSALAETEEKDRALIILAAGFRNHYAFLPPIERLSGTTLHRLIGAARIYRDHGPFSLVIVSGTGLDYVQAMADYLVIHGVPKDRIVLEPLATDTQTNAIHSARVLEEQKKTTVVLATSALHMHRSVFEFERAGVQVLPAPVDYVGRQKNSLAPSSWAAQRTYYAVHEILGHLKPKKRMQP